MNYEETVNYLYNSAPLFQQIGAGAYKDGLENTHRLDEHFGHPHQYFKTIHVAGTNGKGSCSHTLAAILQRAGYKVGLYTSPHLVDFRERIRVNGQMIPQSYVVDFVEKERAFFEPLHPSFFELTTALAFKYFADEYVDIAVIEVGLGGRLDCTNIIQPILSIITNISFDHTQFLGSTLAQIAFEKAGIIKSHTPIIIGETQAETAPVFQAKAKDVNATICFAEDKPIIRSSYSTQRDTVFGRTYTLMNGNKLFGELGGICQSKNANTILHAVLCLQEMRYPIHKKEITEGFANVCELTGLMGRWQKLGNSPLVICDTGHNVGGWKYLSEQLKAITCSRLRIVIGMVSDKDITGVLKLLPTDAVYYFTEASVKRALPATEFQKVAESIGLKGEAYPLVSSAYEAALKDASSKDFIFVGGSNFIVADLLKHLQNG